MTSDSQERLVIAGHSCVATPPSPSRKPFEHQQEQGMVIRNPAPDASPPSAPSQSCTYSLKY